MIIKLCVCGFICVMIYFVGCEVNVKEQIDYVILYGLIVNGLKKVFVIGVLIGYGFVVWILVVFGLGVDMFGVFFECVGSEMKLGMVGWYNSVVFEKFVMEKGLYVCSINGDVFFDKVKQVMIDIIKQDFGKVDLVVYSFVVLCCMYLKMGEIISLMFKLVGKVVMFCGFDIDKEVICEVLFELVMQEEIDGIVVVMGGEDWQMWIDVLVDVGVLVDGVKIIVFMYFGEQIMYDIYWNGLIGEVKKDFDKKVLLICDKLVVYGGDVCVLVLKVVVMQVSLVILMMLLYLLLLFKVMKEKGMYEGCIEQVYGFLKDSLYGVMLYVDEEGCLCVDYKEFDL